VVTVQIPAKFAPLREEKARYKVGLGGRYSLKSWNFCRALILKAAEEKHRILCTRELQRSIKDSVHRLIETQAEQMQVGGTKVLRDSIKIGRSEFIFLGLRHNSQDIKSLEGVTICWCEEAENMSEESWRVLPPTIRKPGSEIWVTYNLNRETDPTHQRMIIRPPRNRIVIESNWRYAEELGMFPEEMREEKDYLKEVDYDAYLHVWEGQPRQFSDAQVLNGKWELDILEPHPDDPKWEGPYYGADWGFSVDPTTLVKFWIYGRTKLRQGILYIEKEAYKVKCDLDDTPALFDSILDSRDRKISADNARPETISHMRKKGFKMEAADKWPGSVEDSIAYLRGFEKIVIHPECKHATQEARDWRYKVDRVTEEITTKLVDANDHIWDAVKYGLHRLIKPGSGEQFDAEKAIIENTLQTATEGDPWD